MKKTIIAFGIAMVLLSLLSISVFGATPYNLTCDETLSDNQDLILQDGLNCSTRFFSGFTALANQSFILDCDGHTLYTTGATSGYQIYGYDNVVIKNCKLEYDRYARIFNSNNITIYNNEIIAHSGGTNGQLYFDFNGATETVRVNITNNELYFPDSDENFVFYYPYQYALINIYNNNITEIWSGTDDLFLDEMVSGGGGNATFPIHRQAFGNYYSVDFYNCSDGDSDGICDNVFNDTTTGTTQWYDLYPLSSPAPYNPCTPDWECNGYEVCIEPLVNASCNSVLDLNTCGEAYTGNYSEFTPEVCDYGFSGDYDAGDIARATISGIATFLITFSFFIGILVFGILFTFMFKMLKDVLREKKR